MTTLPIVLCIVSTLASLAQPSQEGQDPKTADESPRATLERGAYAEEHTRDLVGAEALYLQALENAEKAGDEALAKEAKAALERVRGRRVGGPLPPTSQESDQITRRILGLLRGLSKIHPDVNNEHADWTAFRADSADLAVFGPAAVPWLEQMLVDEYVSQKGVIYTLDTRMAARLLASLKLEEADAALARALQSKDPLVRRAVVDWLSAHQHRSLLEQALEDPVPQVRTGALDKLLRYVRDPELIPLVEADAMTGNIQAIRWLGDYAPERFLEMMAAADAEPEFLQRAVYEVHRARLNPTTEVADVFLRLAREVEGEDERNGILNGLQQKFRNDNSWRRAPDSLRHHVEERLLSDLAAYTSPGRYALLAEVGGAPSFAALSRELSTWPEDRPAPVESDLERATTRLLKDRSAEDFPLLAQLNRELPRKPGSSPDDLFGREWHAGVGGRLRQLAESPSVSAEDVAAGFDGLEGVLREYYYPVVQSWLDKHLYKSEKPGAEELAPLVPALRALLESGKSSYQVNAILGLQRIDIEAAVSQVEEEILAGRLDPEAIKHFADPYGLSMFQNLWNKMESRSRLGRSFVDHVSGDGVLDEIVVRYPEMEGYLKVRAIERLAGALHEPAIPILGEALEDPSSSVRAAAREAFAAFKAHREALEEYAAWTLGDRAAREQVDELTALLASDDPAVVQGAVKAIGAVRARAALPELVKLLERDDETLQAAVYEAIERIGD